MAFSLFRKEKKNSPLKKGELYLKFYRGEEMAFQYCLMDLPLKESVILEYSLRFFNDPAPCYIHRGAVQMRLLAELEEELKENERQPLPPKLAGWADLPWEEGLVVLAQKEKG